MSRLSRPGVETVIEARQRELGGLNIRRVLPSRQRQMVGPFIFFDHIGPETLAPGRGIDVPPHPHIDLATVTYLFEGDLIHRDSLGFVETIRPGEINWMHAGRGIVHSERTGPELRKKESRIHGIQLWAALPVEKEDTPPEFQHYSRDDLPVWSGNGVAGRVLVGEAFGLKSPVRTASPALYMDVTMAQDSQLEIPDAPERGVYAVEGTMALGSEEFGSGKLIVLSRGSDLLLAARSPLRCLILGGAGLANARHIWWNFVSSSLERIQRAKRDWETGRFPEVPGDEGERMPLPG